MNEPRSPKRLILLHDDDPGRTVLGEVQGDTGDPTGRYRVLVESDRMVLLHREPVPHEKQARIRVLMSGEILYQNTVLEIVNMVVSSRWSGTLHIHGRDSHRLLGIEKGALRHAQSDDPEDRLNKVLFRLGVISVSQSESVERMPREDQRFGKGLVEKGFVPERDLFRYLQEQMREIFFSCLLEEEGVYAFVIEEGPRPAPPMIAFLPMQQMLFDGAERLDWMKEYHRLVPDEELCPVVQPGVEVTHLEPKVRRVLGFCDGSRTVRDIATETWLGRYETMGVLHELAKRDHVEFRPAPRTPIQVAERLIDPFNAALADIVDTSKGSGDLERTLRELASWVERGEFHEYLKDALSDESQIRPGRIADVLDGLKIRDREEVVAEALEQLVSYALFAASLSLSRETERSLTRRVHKKLQPS